VTVEKVCQPPPREAAETPVYTADALDGQLPTNFPEARRLLSWIRQKGLREVSRKQVMQRGPSIMRNAASARPALGVLVEYGWLVTEDDSRFLLTPAALAAFSESLKPSPRLRTERRQPEFDWSQYPRLNREAVEQLQEYRVKMGWRRLDWYALSLSAHRLEAYDAETQLKMFQQSIANSWLGVYPLRRDLQGHATHAVEVPPEAMFEQ
jgi:hypothetical protein